MRAPCARRAAKNAPEPRTGFREIHVALILLRRRAGKTQSEVAREVDMGIASVGRSETPLGQALEIVDPLLTYYKADLALCHRLIVAARRHLGDLSQIRSARDISRQQTEQIWADAESEGGDREHISKERMFAFLRLRLSRTENQRLVRHLLSGCRPCRRLANEALTEEGYLSPVEAFTRKP